MTDPVRMLGIAGSLRKESYNRAALRAAAKRVPQDDTLEIFDLDGIPAFAGAEGESLGRRCHRDRDPGVSLLERLSGSLMYLQGGR